MQIRAELNYLHIAPRKVRLVARAVRGKSVPEAERVLRFLTRRSALPILKLLRAAASDARHNFQLRTPDALIVREITVNAGPTLKRSRPRAMGRAYTVRKRTSRVSLILESPVASTPHRRPARADIAVLDESGAGASALKAETPRTDPSPGRAAPRLRPRTRTKPTDFVRRMFQRKAI